MFLSGKLSWREDRRVLHLRALDIRRVGASVTHRNPFFSGVGQHHKLVGRGATDQAGIGFDRAEI